jgi:hypothetical protein
MIAQKVSASIIANRARQIDAAWEDGRITIDQREHMMTALLPAMDDDETACGPICQQLNDAAWAKLGPVADVELPF